MSSNTPKTQSFFLLILLHFDFFFLFLFWLFIPFLCLLLFPFYIWTSVWGYGKNMKKRRVFFLEYLKTRKKSSEISWHHCLCTLNNLIQTKNSHQMSLDMPSYASASSRPMPKLFLVRNLFPTSDLSSISFRSTLRFLD